MKETEKETHTVKLNLTDEQVFVWGEFGLAGYTESSDYDKTRDRARELNLQEQTEKGLAAETN